MKISEIILYTSNIKAQKQFYSEVLNFEILEATSEKISFKTGNSTLAFQYKSISKPSHLAFNIPSNKIEEALKWLQQRVEVSLHENKSIIDFPNWNAEAVYFYDKDFNIMEFIARRDLGIKSERVFSAQSIISISEIAIATTTIESIYNKINSIIPIAIFDGDFDRFCALGNDEGLFILIDKTKKKWFPSNETAYTSDFIIKGDYNFSFLDGKIEELS